MQTDVRSRMAVFLFTDIVDSTAIQGRLGTDAYLRSLAHHDALFKKAVVASFGGHIVEHTGDGFLTELASPSDAVNAALLFQSLMHQAEWPGETFRSRCAIHLGELTQHLDPQTGESRHAGMAINVAARLMDLGQGGQILLSRAAFDDARRNVRVHPMAGAETSMQPLRWEAHGRYLFKGSEDPIEVFEVGVPGLSPLQAPPDSNKVRRYLDAEEMQTLGWRPAVGLEIPRRDGWVLDRKIGEGGFGEVWLARHHRLNEQRVFKFCFDAARLRSFRREVTLFRLLRDVLGDREDIAQLYDVQVEKPPFFLESEYCVEGPLGDWAERQGGIARVPLDTRLDLLARTARAVAAAHSAGVIHKDIKPANVLISLDGGQPRPRLADFGIGVLADRRQLEQHAIPADGFTEKLMTVSDGSRTGTRLYAAPEYLSGGPATPLGDVYSLGVMLYQLVAGDLGKPLGSGWERDVTDELLREDIADAVDVDVKRRIPSAAALAERVEKLAARRQEREHERRNEARLIQQRQRRKQRVQFTGNLVVIVVGLIFLVSLMTQRKFELMLYDWRARLAASHATPPAPQLGLLQLTDFTSIRLRDGFPLNQSYYERPPRHLHGRVLRELAAQGAKLVAFDVLFLDDRPDHSKTTGSDGAEIESDEFFANEMAASGRTILASMPNLPPSPRFRNAAHSLGDVTSWSDRDSSTRRVRAFVDCTFPSPRLLGFAREHGYEISSNETNLIRLWNRASGQSQVLELDKEGQVRFVTPEGAIQIPAYESRRIWNLGIVLAAEELGLDLNHPEILPNRLRLHGTNGVERVIPLDREGCFIINWLVRSDGIPRQDYIEVLEADTLRQANPTAARPTPWKDKLVVIGSTATGDGMTGIGPTPLFPLEHLVMVHLNVANSVLQDRFIRQIPAWFEWLLIALFGVVSASVAWRFRVSAAVSILGAVGMLYVTAAVWLYLSSRLWIPIVSPVLALIAGQMIFLCQSALRDRSDHSPVGMAVR